MIENGLPYPIPSAGPYYLATRSNDVLVLKPNPNYQGPRPQRLDAIVYHANVAVDQAATLIARGKLDYLEEVDPALAPGTDVAQSAGPRYRLTRNNWTEGLALNPARPVFADLRTRRAVAYGVDRRSLAEAIGNGFPTSHILAPSSPGNSNGAAYPSRGNPDVARRLVGGHSRQAVFAVIADDAGVIYDGPLVRHVQEQLGAIGFDVTLLVMRQSDTADPVKLAGVLARADLARIDGNADTTRDPVANLLRLPFLPAGDRASLLHIATLLPPHREEAAATLAAKLEREALYVAYAYRVTPELVSPRLGCVVEHPKYPGLDLAALCLPKKGRG